MNPFKSMQIKVARQTVFDAQYIDFLGPWGDILVSFNYYCFLIPSLHCLTRPTVNKLTFFQWRVRDKKRWMLLISWLTGLHDKQVTKLINELIFWYLSISSTTHYCIITSIWHKLCLQKIVRKSNNKHLFEW